MHVSQFLMTQILYQKSFITFSENKYGQNMINVQERLKGATAEADFWYGENIDHVKKKKLKIASFTKAPFMVKFDI